MCYFVTIGIHETETETLVQAVPRGMALAKASNRSITKHLDSGWRTFLLTSGMCSCGLYSESVVPLQRDISAARRRKYQKLGWSDAKISRAIASAESHQSAPTGFVGLRADVRAMLALIATQAGELAVVAHWYDDDLVKERFELTVGPRVSPEQLRQLELPTLSDQLLIVSTKIRSSAAVRPSNAV